MNNRRNLIAFLLFCLAGLAAFLLLFPRFDISTRDWKTSASRQDVIDKARALASAYHLDTSNWSFHVTTTTSRERLLARRIRPDNPIAAYFTTMYYVVAASRPDSPTSVLITLTSDLKPLSFRTFGPRRPPGNFKGGKFGKTPGRPFGRRPDGIRPPDLPPPGATETIDIASQLSLYAGPNAPNYRQTAFAIPTADGLRSAWEWSDPSEPGLTARLQIFVRRGNVVRSDHEIEIASTLIAAPLAEYQLPQSLSRPIGQILIAVTMFLSFWYFFSAVARTFVPFRFGAALLPWFLVPLTVGAWLGPGSDAVIVRAIRANSSTSASQTNNLFGLALSALGFVAVLAAGRSILPYSERAGWLSLQSLQLRRVLHRHIGIELLAGLAAGPAIASLPYLCVFFSGRSELSPALSSGATWLTSAHPWAAVLEDAGGMIPLSCFGLVWPWTLSKPRLTRFAFPIAALYGIVAILIFVDPLAGSRSLALIASALVFLGLWITFRAAGLLASWTAYFSLTALCIASGFYLNGLRSEALSAIAPALLLALAAAALALFGRPAERHALIDSFEIHPREHIVNERARLDAEFSVATAAQRRLLPSSAPVLPGYSLAGSCTPAREVGGDLFDYMPLPGGQLGLCVADVSGKGVPAALYMTLTKGMLLSAKPRHLPLPTLASRLNRHLLATGKRKTFVTMSLAVLDPATRRFTHVRAGHNPPLLYRSASKSWALLKPRGLGLGLASPAAFDRILAEEQIDLLAGDVAVLYSDGLTEMMNPDRELFGEDRLALAVAAHSHLSAQAIHDAILDSARHFQAGAEQHDDLTLLVLKADLSLT